MCSRKSLIFLVAFLCSLTAYAQRFIDNLDRGLVAVSCSKGVYLSWRVQSDEYYDVKYNLYCNGERIAENLNTSNFTDANGSATASYQVAAVVRGVEQEKCNAVMPWANDYMEIKPKHASMLKSTYQPNDACCADVDGDGQLEILLKYNNVEEGAQGYPKAGPTIDGVQTKEYTLMEVLRLDGTVLWWVNCGPNMGDFQNNEQNIVGYDWDLDGRAEVVMRLCEGAEVHLADGTTYIIGADSKNGTAWTNYRIPHGGGVEWFTYYGNEFLWYCEGKTGKPYQCIAYPCARFEAGESDLNKAWGDGYGHRASKFFFGAPYLDGHKPSIFLGRGIYTRHKFVALDVDPSTHILTERWRWMNNSPGAWYGQGYHNYGIADVDMDGRDEIVWGSMVIDDNGKGLSTCGLGHGDSQHHGDFDPYSYGLEGFFCNESSPANNYRDLTTSKFYHRFATSGDDGRAIAGNFCGSVPGAMAFSAHENPISCATGNVESSLTKDGVGMNFRCYWDGDLLEETFNGGDNAMGSITKYGSWTSIRDFTGTVTNNGTKATPSYMGDIFGDWREEFICRTPDNNLRIFTTTTSTKWRMQSLWYDHQYRNGMVWEPCGYNQPPHVSFFVGEQEGYTAAPPSLTMKGRQQVKNGGTISGSGTDIIACENNDMTISIADGAAPANFIDNAPSWVQGSAPSEATSSSYAITTKYYKHTLTGGAFTGAMNLVKQGAGTLVMPNTTHTYTGKTDVWEGSLCFDGKLPYSRVFLNRHTALNSDGGEFGKSIEAYYNAVIRPGGLTAKAGSITADSVIMRYGAMAELDIYSDGLVADKINANVLFIEKKYWNVGPKYMSPVFKIVPHAASGATAIADGVYEIGEVGKVVGNLSNIIIEGLTMQKATLSHDNGKLLLTVQNFDAQPVTWTGANGSNWNVNADSNFKTDASAETSPFYNGADVTFDDNASVFNVVIKENVAPRSVLFNNEQHNYTITGDKSIVGTPNITKRGEGKVTISNLNETGYTFIEGGSLFVSSLANTVGTECGALGKITKPITIKNEATLGISNTLTNGQRIICSQGGGQISVASGATFTQSAEVATSNGGGLIKSGTGHMIMTGALNAASLRVASGGLDYSGTAYSKKTTLANNAAIYGTGFLATPLTIEEGAKASYTTVNRTTASNALTGSGQVTIYCATEKGNGYYATRTPLALSLTNFEGTIVADATYSADGRFTFNTSAGSDKWTLNIPENRFVQNAGKTLRIGKVTGKGSLGGTCTFSSSANTAINTWNVGNADDFQYDGTVVDNARFTKMGSGKMTVAKTWTTSGAVTVSEGTMQTKSAVYPGTGALTVNAGATYIGVSAITRTSAKNSPLTNSSMVVNGTFQCGSSATASFGFFYFGSKSLTLKSTSTYRVGVMSGETSSTNPGCTYIFGDGSAASLTVEDGATIEVYLASTYNPATSIGIDPTKADAIHVFGDFANVKVGKVNFVLPELPAGYVWDTTLFNTGYLYIRYTGADVINNVTSGAQSGKVYTTTGVQIKKASKGVYIKNGKKFVAK